MTTPNPAPESAPNIEPTLAQVKAELDALKAVVSGMHAGPEKDKVSAEIADLKQQLYDLKNQAAPPTPPRAGRLMDHLDALKDIF